jgi:hypothetical protein
MYRKKKHGLGNVKAGKTEDQRGQGSQCIDRIDEQNQEDIGICKENNGRSWW